MPFELIRKRFDATKPDYKIVGSNNVVNINSETKEVEISGGEEYLYSLTIESKILSEKIFSRAGVYLLIGILIAILGIAYFSYATIEKVLENTYPLDWDNILITFLPRIGALFFVEFIAFFFLRQYRITMDEFRYYEMIKRQRESNLTIMLIQSEFKSETEDFDELMKHLNLFGNPDLVKKDETTSLLESRKYSNEELDVFKMIIEKLDLRK